MVQAVSILTDNTGKTIGASFYCNGQIKRFKTEDLAGSNMVVSNAVITKDGYVRSKEGNLPKEIFNPEPTAVHLQDKRIVSKYLSQEVITLYHGNKDRSMVPKYGMGRLNSDYGQGFYLTPDIELGREWAYNQYNTGDKGYLHTYSLSLKGLSVLDLSCCRTEAWIAELISHRNLTDIFRTQSDIDLFVSKYRVNSECVDVMIGYRADDSFYNYAKSFVMNRIPLSVLEDCLRSGRLGMQFFLKSQKALNALSKIKVEYVSPVYAQKAAKRLKLANKECNFLLRTASPRGEYFMDILRKLRRY